MQNDKCWQIITFASQSPRDPRADAGTAELSAAGIHEELGGGVIEKVCLAGLYEGDLVNDFGGVREQVADPRAGLTRLSKAAFGGQQVIPMAAVHKCEAFACCVAFRDWFAVEFGEQWFVFKEVQL